MKKRSYKFSNFIIACAGPIMLMSILTSCSRATKDTSSSLVRIDFSKANKENSSQGFLIPAGYKACYGVLVSGPGIIPTPNLCGNSYGLYSGFVNDGETLSLSVPKGTGRSIEVLLNLVPEGALCTNWNMRFGATPLQLRSTYMAGSVENVSLNSDTVAVDVGISFPGIENNIMVTHLVQACSNSMKGQLLSNGDVLDSSLLPDTNLSSETNLSYFISMLGDILVGTGLVSTANEFTLNNASPLQIPPYVYSVTSKPDSGQLYGLVGEGQIVRLNFNGTEYEVEEMNATTCPFALLACEVPGWAQSISAGLGQELYMLDHGGTIYRVFPDGSPKATGDSVDENVTQISYF